MWSIAKFGAVVVLIGGTGASAAEMVTERVKSIDQTGQVIVLEDGRELALRPGIDISGVSPGAEVTLDVERVGEIEIVTGLRIN